MESRQSELGRDQISIGKKFEQDGRIWEVIQINFNSFNAKTIDNSTEKHGTRVEFMYKK